MYRKRLVVGIFNPTLHAIGGGEYATLVMINTLKKQGYRVIVFSSKKINSQKIVKFYGEKYAVDSQITFPILSSIHWNPVDVKCVYLNMLGLKILRSTSDILIDVFSGVMLPWADITYLQILGKDFNVKGFHNLFLLPYTNILKLTKTENKTLIACSKFVAKNEEKRGLRCGVLYPPVDVNYFSYCKAIEQSHHIKKDQVITVSRISMEKNLENIPKIAKLVDNGIKFFIVGGFESYTALSLIRETIKKLNVGNRVKILINISREKLRELLLESKVYLHTRKNEPFGITIVEAMSAGCIPVVHNSGGPCEFVPTDLRYQTLLECVKKVEREVGRWSDTKAFKMNNISKKFSKEKFSERFLDILSKSTEKFDYNF